MNSSSRSQGLPDNLLLPTDPIQAHANLPGLDKTLQDEAVENLRRWYRTKYLFLDLCRSIIRERDFVRN